MGTVWSSSWLCSIVSQKQDTLTVITHGEHIAVALKKLNESRGALDVRIGVLERKINDADARLREVHIARTAKTIVHKRALTRNEIRIVRRSMTQRRLYERALAQLDAMVTNNEAVVMQLQNSQVVTQALNALSAGAEAGRVHDRELHRLDVDALLEQLAEQQATLDDVVLSMNDTAAIANGEDDAAELERELERLLQEQDVEHTFDEHTLRQARLATLAELPPHPDADLFSATNNSASVAIVHHNTSTIGVEELEPLMSFTS